MKNFTRCLLCNSEIKLFYKKEDKKYYKCKNCLSVMLDPSNYLSNKEEKERYKNHNNDVEDLGYQEFVAPIVGNIKKNYKASHIGLDYGAGRGPVITSLLEKEGYNIKLYDPYFHYYPKNLLENYDYIICSEVIEHFYKPYDEFKNLSKMLNSKGSIVCMTSLYDEEIDFENWYYKDDDTHVFFYHKKSLEWIKNRFAYSDLKIEDNLIVLSK